MRSSFGVSWNRAFLTMLLLAVTAAHAQTSSTAPLTGTVMDPSGAVIPAAKVTVLNEANGAVYSSVTEANGTFNVPSLPSGMYTVTVAAAGFKQQQVVNVKMDVGVPSNIEVRVEVGTQTETVTVAGSAALVQTQSTAISTTLVGRQIIDLPLTSRDALDLVLNLPGVSTPGRPRTSTIDGMPMSAINITLDGINVQDNLGKSTDGYFTYVRPRLDAIGEVTYTTATAGADSSGEGAVQIKFATRSGTNEYHGSLYEYLRNTAFNANYWFNNRDLPADPNTGKAPRTKANLHQYGFRVGGPIGIPKLFSGRNRLFFFFNYEEYRLPEAASRTRTVLDPLTQTGVFQYNSTNGVQRVNLLNLAQANGQTATVDPIVGQLLADIRSTTAKGGVTAGSDPNLQRFSYIAKGGQWRKFPTGRIDWNINGRNSLEASYNYQDFAGLVDFLNGTDPAFPGFPNQGSQGSNRFLGVVAWRSTITSHIVNEARAGLVGGTTLFFPEVAAGQFSGTLANQGGYNLNIGAAGITSATVSSAPSRRNTPVKQFNDNLSILHGQHNITLGTSFSQINSWQLSNTVVSTITLGVDTNDPANAMFTAANFPGASSTDLNNAKGIYATLTGRVTAISGNAQLDETGKKYVFLGPNVQRYQQRETGVFAEDAWRVRQNLTLNLGLRWEVEWPVVALNNKWALTTYDGLFGISGKGNLFKPNTLTGAETLFNPAPAGTHLYQVFWKNFAPTGGLAWTPNVDWKPLKWLFNGDRGVLRAGYTLSYNREGATAFGLLNSNPGGFINAGRSISLGNLVTGAGGDVLPVLFRQPIRLGPASFSPTPAYPMTGVQTDSANAVDPNLKMPYVHSWSLGIQRSIGRATVVEVRYVGNFGKRYWSQINLNETNIVENGFLSEFKLAQQNLQSNLAANRGGTFKYFGTGTGTSPLPIIQAYFSGLPAAQAGDATKYTSSNYTSTTFVNPLALQNPGPNGFASSLYGNATFRTNAVKGGLPVNLFPGESGQAGRSQPAHQLRRLALQRGDCRNPAAVRQRSPVQRQLHLRQGVAEHLPDLAQALGSAGPGGLAAQPHTRVQGQLDL